jgi:hypothetical protein
VTGLALTRPGTGTHRAGDAIADRDSRIRQLEADLAAAVFEIKRLQQKVWRDAADKQRLRQAVIDARPRITQVDTQLVRPFAPEVVLPYVSPVPHRDTSGETTQQLPVIDLPGRRSPAA